MAVILQFGRPRSRRTIEERLSGPVFDDLVVIVPTRRRIRHLVREVMIMTGRPVTPAFPFFTLETFARSLYASIDAPRRLVGGAVQTLLFQLAVDQEREGFSYFTPRRGTDRMFPGTFERIIDVVLHLKESGIVPDLLREEAAATSLDEQHKLNDVAGLYGAYERVLEAFHATDVAGVFNHFYRECSSSEFRVIFRALHPRADLLSLSGFDEFTQPEVGLIQKLTEVPDLSVNLLFDYEHGNPALFGHLEANYRKFRELGFVPVREEAPRSQSLFPISTMSRSARSRAAADVLARTLFLTDRPAERADLRASVTLMTAMSRRHEVELICKLIKHLAAQDPDLDLGSICVGMHQPQLYTDLFREASARFGIPANITDRYHLSRSPLVASMLALLRVPVVGYRRDEVLRVATSPYFSFVRGRTGLDGGTLSRISAELRITAGESSWEEKIRRRLAAEKERLVGEKDTREQRRIRRKLVELERAASDIAALRSVLNEIPGTCTPRVFHQRFLALMSRLEITRNLVLSPVAGGEEYVERDARAYTRFRDAVEESVRLVEFEHGREKAHSLAYYLERLTTAVLRERYNVREQFGCGVLVTSIDETRGLSMRIMIVAGLVDGEFPSMYQPEVFLSAPRRRERERKSLWQNRYQFYQAVTNWTDHLYLTYPRREGEIDLVRSSFVDALRAVAWMEDWPTDEEIPFSKTLACDDEVLRWFSLNPDVALPAGLAGDAGFAERREAVGHAAAVEQSRVTDHALAAYEGKLGPDLPGPSRAVLAGLRERVFSVSQLETYRKCPFKFLAERILLLDTSGDLEESLTPLERGAILHDALFDFFVRRREAGLSQLGGCSEEEFERAVIDLAAVVERRLAVFDVADPFWDLERELLVGRPGVPGGLVREFLESERLRDVQTVPRYFEVSFGDVGGSSVLRDPLLLTPDPVVIGGVRLRGKIDRIEIGEGFFSVVDYKTGKSLPGIEEIREGVSLQLPVYLRVAQVLLESADLRDLVPAAGLYYRLRTPVRPVPGLASGRFNRRAYTAGATSRQVLKSDDELREVTDGAVGMLGEAVQDIASGIFSLTSPKNIDRFCSMCDYRTMCRIQIVRHVQPKAEEEG